VGCGNDNLRLCIHQQSVTIGEWYIAGILTIVSNVFFGISIVFYNAFLPLLVEADPTYIAAVKDGKDENQLADLSEKICNELSTHGFAAGFVSGFVLLMICAILALAWPGDDVITPLAVSIFLSGLWWFGFSFFTFKYLKNRPGPKLPPNVNYFSFSWIRGTFFVSFSNLFLNIEEVLYLVYV